MKLYEPDDALLDINPKNPRVYVSLGEEWNNLQHCMLYLIMRENVGYITILQKIFNPKLFYCWLTHTILSLKIK